MDLFFHPLILKLFFVCLAAMITLPVTFYIYPDGKRTKPRLVLASAVNALLVLFFLVFYLNSKAGYGSENEIPYRISEIISTCRSDENPGNKFLRDNFILINTANSNYVIEDKNNPDEGNSTVITDRRKLAMLLKVLNENSNQVDLVVCDLVFQTSSLYDSLLRETILDLSLNNKIILAKGSGSNCALLNFDNSIMADATELLQSNKIAEHKIFKNNLASMPYAMYSRIHETSFSNFAFLFARETNAANEKEWIYNSFIPRLRFNNENELYQINPFLKKNLSGTFDEFGGYHELGFLTSQFGTVFLKSLLNDRKKDSTVRRNIVFIGEFPGGSKTDDVHKTLNGDLFGATIILNIFYELEQHSHFVESLPLLILFMAFGIITLFIIKKAFNVPSTNVLLKGHPVTLYWRFIFTLIKEERHFIVFVLAMLLIDIGFQQPSNLMPLLVYFVVYEKLLRFVIEHTQKSATKESGAS